MATIKGKWVFNEEIADAQAVSQNVSFSSNTIPYSTMYFSLGSIAGTPVLHYDEEIVFDLVGFDADFRGWKDESYRTVDFGTTEQTVSDIFLTWMQANATPEVYPIPTDKVSVLYKGELIGTIDPNNEGIIGCTGETMKDDITIRVPTMESGGAGATVYSIDWDTSDLTSVAGLDILFLPTSICAGQAVAGVIFAGQIIVNASNCDIHEKTVTIPSYYQGYSGTLTVVEVSNPTGDINIVVAQSHAGGSN